jgi:hypothetical protein
VEDPDKALELVERAVGEMKDGNYEEIIGMVEDEWFTEIMQGEHKEMLT